MSTWDVVVIGSGMAGTAAALSAASRGAKVALIQSRPGATALCNGSWTGPLLEPVRAALAGVGYELVEAPDLLPAPDGSLLRCGYAAQTHVAPVTNTRSLVCGIAGLPGFHAATLARMWGELTEAELLSDEILLSNTPASGWSPAALSAAIEADTTPLGSLLHGIAKTLRVTHVILPAVLGLSRSQTLRATLQHIAGCSIAEALGSIPSIPGARLQRALSGTLTRGKVTVLPGKVIGRELEGKAIRGVTLDSDNTVRARSYILATGKFVGGGIEADEQLAEPALNCPVWVDHLGERFTEVEPLTLTNADRHDEQPLLRAGLACDPDGRPLGPFGDLVYENVWTAGSVRAGPIASLGRAAAEGWAAGERVTA